MDKKIVFFILIFFHSELRYRNEHLVQVLVVLMVRGCKNAVLLQALPGTLRYHPSAHLADAGQLYFGPGCPAHGCRHILGV